MANSEKNKSASSATGDIFDIQRVRQLVELMKENDLTELNIQQGDLKIQLQRGSTYSAPPMPSPAAFPPLPPGFAVPAPAPSASPVPAIEDANAHIIKSPMVGTFYAAADPEAPPFVKVGDSVAPEKTVCLIEAMKVFNEIQAEISGTVVAVLAKNGQPVEYGTPLFKVVSE